MISAPFIYTSRKRATVLFSIDDCHPARSQDGYDAGGDYPQGALGLLEALLNRHSQLKCTLFVTADWREVSVSPTRRILAQIPYLRDRAILVSRWPKAKMRLDRHPAFVKALLSLPRTEIAAHGLEHVGRGREVVQEFKRLDLAECRLRLKAIRKIFNQAGLPQPLGFAPPGWALTPPLLQALSESDYRYVCSARDLKTPFLFEAKTQGSGIQGVPLFVPGYLERTKIAHLAANWSVNSDFQRAEEIIEGGGILSIKAHITKHFFGHTSLDGLDKAYSDYLSRLFAHLENKYGEQIEWATFAEAADRFHMQKANVPQSV